MSKRMEQKEQRRLHILETALDLFIRKGYGETRIVDIARASNMSMGLLFHYFESKEKLYEVLVRSGCERMSMEINLETDSPLDFFRRAVEDIFFMITSSPSAAKMFVLMEQAHHSTTLPQELKNVLTEADRLIENCVPLIEQGQLLGELRAGDPKALSIAFWCSIQGIAQQLALNPDAPCPDAEWVLSIIKMDT